MRSVSYIIHTLPVTSRTFQIGDLRMSRFSRTWLFKGALGFSSKCFSKAHFLSCAGLLGIILFGGLMRPLHYSRKFLLSS